MSSSTKSPLRPRLAAASLSLVLLSAGLATWQYAGRARLPSSSASSFSEAAASAPALRFGWTPGVRYLYALSWTADSNANLLPTASSPSHSSRAADQKPVAFGSAITSDVAVRVFSAAKDSFTLGISLQDIQSFQVRVSGHAEDGDLAAVRRAMEGPEARFTVDGRGIVREIAFPVDMSASLRTTLQALVEQIQVTLPEKAASTWEASELDPNGSAHAIYDLASDGQTIHRTRTAYATLVSMPNEALSGKQTVGGGDAITLDREGTLVSVRRADDVRYVRAGESLPALRATSVLSLERKSVAAFEIDPTPVALDTRPLGATSPEPGRGAKIDAQLAEGLSPEGIALAINAFNSSNYLPKNFTTRAGAYLRLHPEACDALLAKFGDKTMTVKGRGLLLDVLTTAGSSEAQKAMRTALASNAAKSDPDDYAVLVQRFSFVRYPDAASVAFVEKALDDSAGPARHGVAAALGSMVRAELGGAGDPALAAACDQKLRDGLKSATTADDKSAFLLGLGNGRTPEDQSAILGLAGDTNANVRAQVASSLNWFDSPSARGALLGLAADGDAVVAREALSSLQSQALGEGDWNTLATLASNGGVPVSLDSALLTLVSRQLGTAGAPGTAILQQIIAQESGQGDVAARAQQLLAVATNAAR